MTVFSQTLKPVTQGLFVPFCAPTLDNLGSTIPCCQHCSNRDVDRCHIHALSGIVGVGGCQCHSACRFTRRVCTRIIRRRQESKKKKRHTHCSQPRIRRVTDGLVLCPCSSLCTRLSQARDGFQNTSNPVQRDFTLVFIESNCLATATPFVFPY